MFFSAEACLTRPLLAEAQQLGIPRHHMNSITAEFACGLHGCAKLAISSLISGLLPRPQSGELQGVSLIRFISYDETPTTVRFPEHHDRPVGPQNKLTKQLVKTLQCELQFVFVVRSARGFQAVMAEVPCLLSAMERGTGEVFKKALTQILHLDGWEERVGGANFDCHHIVNYFCGQGEGSSCLPWSVLFAFGFV